MNDSLDTIDSHIVITKLLFITKVLLEFRFVKKLDQISLLSSFDDKLLRTCEEAGLLDPIVLLVGLANGKDLTGHSALYEWVLTHESINGDEPPDDFDWLTLLELIKSEARYMPVDTSTKLTAQRTLAEYQHNKRRSVEISEKSKVVETPRLSRQEIKKFERNFKDEY